MEKNNMKELFIIDANSLIHRAFHALPPFTSPDGKPTGALYGITNILLKILRERAPEYVVAAYDTPEATFREKDFAEYKGTRAPTDSTLIPQIIESKNIFDLLGIKRIEHPGWEADDIVATLAKKFSDDLNVVIFSGDLDILQAVRGKRVVAITPKKGISESITYDEDKVLERFLLPPEKLADYKGLVGDTSDNIPGVKGIGPKTAAMLIQKYGTLEDMYKEIEELGMSNAALLKKLVAGKESALMSKKLAKLDAGMQIDIKLKDLRALTPDAEKLIKYLDMLGFKGLVARLKRENGV
ncbi:MAG: 5'-3' exonuclease [Candidatus Colwellbacteria bacterium]|nr:5'-3' exonuclease [Candidatus Colwellbacteria bacterium]